MPADTKVFSFDQCISKPNENRPWSRKWNCHDQSYFIISEEFFLWHKTSDSFVSFFFYINHKHKKKIKEKERKSEQVFEKGTDQQHEKIFLCLIWWCETMTTTTMMMMISSNTKYLFRWKRRFLCFSSAQDEKYSCVAKKKTKKKWWEWERKIVLVNTLTYLGFFAKMSQKQVFVLIDIQLHVATPRRCFVNT